MFHQVSNSKDATQVANNPAGAARPISIVGIARLGTAGPAGRHRYFLLEFLIVINIVFGLLNMLPMIPFDGGHVAVAVYEWIRTKKGQPYYKADITKLFPVVFAFMAFLAIFVRLQRVPRPHPPHQEPLPLIGRMELTSSLLTPRRPTRRITLGGVPIGDGAPVTVQSMTTTKTADVDGTLAQIYALAAAGADIVRCTCNEEAAAEGLAQIVPRSPGPDRRRHPLPPRDGAGRPGGRRAGPAAQPGQPAQGGRDQAGGGRGQATAASPSASGSTPDRCTPTSTRSTAAPRPRRWSSRPASSWPTSTRSDFDDVKISVKASSVALMIAAYRLASETFDHPLHLGVTEAGPPPAGLLKGTAGIATLLAEGIGDTIRYSLTADPVEEARAGRQLLESLGLRERKGLDLIACPSCGRAEIDVIAVAKEAQEALEALQPPHPGGRHGLRGQRPRRGPRGRHRDRRRQARRATCSSRARSSGSSPRTSMVQALVEEAERLVAEGVEARLAAADSSAEAEAEADRQALLESTGADPNHTSDKIEIIRSHRDG